MSNQERARENPGPPDISFAGFQLWIHGRELENTQDYWDANWLRVTAHYGAAGADVWVQGSILHLGERESWLQELEKMSRTMSGKADLAPMEPELDITFEMGELRHISAQTRITLDNQHHEFHAQIDQSYLPGLIRQIRMVLQDYPVRGKRP